VWGSVMWRSLMTPNRKFKARKFKAMGSSVANYPKVESSQI
jgi:hypothetical protein